MKLILALILALPMLAQTKDSAPRYIAAFTVATLPSAAAWSGYVVAVTDAATAGSCTSGGGSAIALCRSSGAAWVTLGGTGAVSSVTAGTSGSMLCSPTTGAVVCDNDGAAVPFLPSNNAFIGNNTFGAIGTDTNCSSSGGTCSTASAGSVSIAAAATTVTVATTRVTANSQIFVMFDSSLGAKLGVTCNTTYAAPYVTARTAATSFVITVAAAPSVTPACYSFFIAN